MSGDWIKMRGNLWDDPRVTAIVDATDSGEAAVVGALYWLWATADQHTEDGVMPGLSVRQIDRKTGLPGFAAAVESVGWIEVLDAGIRICRFDEHNGESAKRRCQDAKRKANVRSVSGKQADKSRTDSGRVPELEKEIEKELDQKQEQKKEPASPNGSRLPADWVLPEDWRAWAKNERADIDPDMQAQSFADYWHGVAGAKGRKADWAGTWRNWIRRADAPRGIARAGPQQPQPVGKQMQGLMALEAMKSGNRMAAGRGTERAAEVVLLVAGSDTRR